MSDCGIALNIKVTICSLLLCGVKENNSKFTIMIEEFFYHGGSYVGLGLLHAGVDHNSSRTFDHLTIDHRTIDHRAFDYNRTPSKCVETTFGDQSSGDQTLSKMVINRPVINRPVINLPVIKRPVIKGPLTDHKEWLTLAFDSIVL